MAWKYPKRLPWANQVVSYRDFNDAVMHVVEEDGRLNEHNWSDDLQTQLTRETDLNDDVGFRVFQVTVEADHSQIYNGSDPDIDVLYAGKGWQRIPEMVAEFTSEGGQLYILCSMQFSVGDIATAAVVYTRLAVRLNGAVLPLSVIGNQDFTASGPLMEAGVSGRSLGVDLDHMINLPPGNHTVEIVADVRPLKTTRATSATSDPSGTDLRAVFYHREFVGWEMR